MPSDAERLLLVTGGTGFLGAALVRALVGRGERVRVLDNGFRGARRRLPDSASCELIEGDVRDESTVRAAMQGVSSVCHLASVNGTRFFYEMPGEVLDVGVRGTINVLDAAAAAGVESVLFVSSSEVYQVPPLVPTPEDVPATIPDVRNPRYSYAGAKLLGELMTLHHAGRFARRLIVRPHNVYGPDMGQEHVIPELALRLRDTMPAVESGAPVDLTLQGDGSQTRAFVYVDDFIRGLLLVLDRGEDRGIYHIGVDEETSIAQIAELIGRTLGLTLRLRAGRGPEGGTPRRCPDIGRLRALGYEPRVSLSDGVERTVRWYVDQAGRP